ncbi:hypothetical protein [Bacillus thuringiensis]|uniref:hypothetical protein n=1 Tax=Bacillus thuringiensis TaxID=1428 RepID=UPI0026E14414|nr:hypothetical protein [Bacillus thuringiensis]MDO6630085.1 hypothetical protein [Bacillus thuringiensis]MDO6700116.1 hypothetical protein [Bacillus thuringiensis]
MIKVKPETVPTELELSNSLSVGYIETAKAIELFSNMENAREKFNFSAYRCDALKKKLKKTFNGKCAYCESKIAGIAATEIEHYRPKKAVKINGEMKYPGYYWLAADFNNLLPSCPACNQIRKYELEDGTCIASGKGNEFPIVDETKRAKVPGEEVNEEPLLLHPYIDDPYKHLKFLSNGFVKIKNNSLRGDVSIQIYGLDRPELVPDRKEQLILVRKDLVNIIKIIDQIKDTQNESGLQNLKSIYNSHYRQLKVFMRNRSAFAEASRQIIHPLLKGIRAEYKKALREKRQNTTLLEI